MQIFFCENKDNINGAGKGGVVDEGGNGVNEDANPQNYQGDGDGGSKYQKDEDTEKNVSADGNDRNGDKNDGGNISKAFCCQSDSTFNNSPNLYQSYKNTSKKSSVYDVRKRKKIKKGKRKRSTCEDDK